jgi:FkbM family methyltransferase
MPIFPGERDRAGNMDSAMSIRDLARYAHRAMHFGALPSHHGAWFVDAGRLYVSDEENRGRQLRRHVGVLQPLVSHTWRRIVRHLQPTVVLDIGANYGEITFCSRYPANCRVFTVEANPTLLPFLERSLAGHPDRPQIRLVSKAASDRAGSVSMTIDEKWSGTSSAVGAMPDPDNRFKGAGPERTRLVEVDAITIDSLLDGMPADRLAIKLDVEGYEARVLRGMHETLARTRQFIAIMEFDGDKLTRAATPPAEALALMLDLGLVARFTRDGGLVEFARADDLPQHCDVILASHRALLEALAPLPRWVRRYAAG